MLPAEPSRRKISGWVSRATPHPVPTEFQPTLNNLVLAAFISANIGEQLVLALFKPNIAVDRHGRVIELVDEDFQGLWWLAKKAIELPHPDPNIWRVAQPIGGLFTDNLWVSRDGVERMSNINVYGFSLSTLMLEKDPITNEAKALPVEVYQIFALIEEMKSGGMRPVEESLQGVLAVVNTRRSISGM